MCLACEPYAQTILDFEEKRIIFGQKTLRVFSDACKDLAWTMHKFLLPYFATLNGLLRCDMGTGSESEEVVVLNYNADGKQYTGDFVGRSMGDTLISKEMIGEFFSFGARVNVNIEGQLSYLMELEKIVGKFLPKDSDVSADVEARPVVQKIAEVETTKNSEQAIDGDKSEKLES
jgi:hypothetical protein